MIIYTDGSAHPNPGPGGFGVIVLDKDKNFCNNNQFPKSKPKMQNVDFDMKNMYL